MKRLGHIQVLRGFAALAVVLFHAFEGRNVSILGQAGVDVFFVISGFIMWLTTAREPQPLQFLAHRLMRIVPLYWLATLAMSIRAHPNPGRFMMSLFFIPSKDGADHVWPILVQGWTLNYELFFYGLFTVALFAPRRFQFGALIGTLIIATALHIFVGGGAIAATYTDPLLLEFGLGLALGWLWMRRRTEDGSERRGGGIFLVSAGLLLLLTSLAVTREPGVWRLLVWGLPATLIVAGALRLEEGAGTEGGGSILTRLGDASYSLYLVHALVLRPSERLFAALPQPLPPILGTIVSIGAAFLVWWWLERPMTDMGRALLERLWPSRRHVGVNADASRAAAPSTPIVP